MGITEFMMGLCFLVLAIGLVGFAPEFFMKNWDSLYDRRSKYEVWRDEWRERRSIRRASRSGSSISMFWARRKKMTVLLLDPRFVPTLMVIGSLLSALICGINHDTRRVIYWIASAALISSMTY